jgi:hypothetical protein
MEAEAVTLVLERCERGGWRHVASEMAAIEIDANPDAEKRRKVRALLPSRKDIILLDEAIFGRAKAIEDGHPGGGRRARRGGRGTAGRCAVDV